MEGNELNDKALSLNEEKGLEVKQRELTPKNRLFLQLLSEGMSTLQAYEKAGYKGSNHAAYQLRSDLKEELIKVLEGQGVDRAGLMYSLKNLIQLPTIEEEIGKIQAKTKLQALNLLFKMVEASKPVAAERPKITAFIVNNGTPQRIIDVTPSEQANGQ